MISSTVRFHYRSSALEESVWFGKIAFGKTSEPWHVISNILTSVNSDEPMQPPFKLRNSKWCSVSSLTVREYSSNKQRF